MAVGEWEGDADCRLGAASRRGHAGAMQRLRVLVNWYVGKGTKDVSLRGLDPRGCVVGENLMHAHVHLSQSVTAAVKLSM